MIHFCNHKKQTQNDAYRRSQRQTAHKSPSHSLTHLFLKTKQKQQKKHDDVSDTWAASLSQRKEAVKTSDIHSDETQYLSIALQQQFLESFQ